MRKLTLAAALTVLVPNAYAADLVYQGSTYAPVYDWSGVYVGIHTGAGWSRIATVNGANDLNGWLLGAHAGVNAQSGDLVYGLEGDLGYRWNRTNLAAPGWRAWTTWEGSLRGRLGFALDRTLLYGTGGVAFTSLHFDGPLGPANRSYTGWTIGAGVEHAFTDNWSARLEYRYTDFGSRTYPNGVAVRLSDHAMRVGVSYKF
jgi:outer membrane immunogenic protein